MRGKGSGMKRDGNGKEEEGKKEEKEGKRKVRKVKGEEEEAPKTAENRDFFTKFSNLGALLPALALIWAKFSMRVRDNGLLSYAKFHRDCHKLLRILLLFCTVYKYSYLLTYLLTQPRKYGDLRFLESFVPTPHRPIQAKFGMLE